MIYLWYGFCIDIPAVPAYLMAVKWVSAAVSSIGIGMNMTC